jgi:predicted dehydrogenase
MHFALLGDHPDGVELARALLDAGHTSARRVADTEELLADPAVRMVIVAGSPTVRAAQLRRALQSERHVVCVHPADESSDIGHEAALIRQDTGFGLLPLLVEPLHPAFRRLRELIVADPLSLLIIERGEHGEVLLAATPDGRRPSFPGWEVVRMLGGDIAEVSGLVSGEEVGAREPVLISGRFAGGGLFQMTLLPGQTVAFWRYTVIGTASRPELLFPQGWHGPASLTWRSPEGDDREEYWEPFDPWPIVAKALESALTHPAGEASATLLTWQDEIRCLELNEAARRSVQRRRTDVLDYQEVNEDVGFKGTMTLLGCALLWVVLLLLVLSRWLPWVGWLMLPLLLGFVLIQFLRYLIPRNPTPPRDSAP